MQIIHLLARLIGALWYVLDLVWNRGRGWVEEKGGALIKKIKDSTGSRKGKKPEPDTEVPLL